MVVGTPEYLARHGTPKRPEDLLRHECLTFRSPTTGALYAWELERGRRTWRVPVRGGVVVNDGLLCTSMAKLGLGLAYALESMVLDELRSGQLQRVLEPFAPTVPGTASTSPAGRNAPRLFVSSSTRRRSCCCAGESEAKCLASLRAIRSRAGVNPSRPERPC